MPITDIYRSVTGKVGDKAAWMRIGAAVAKEYRKRNPDKKLVRVERLIDGTTRMVNVYSTTEDPWLVEFVQSLTK